jgi:hypothetical protein
MVVFRTENPACAFSRTLLRIWDVTYLPCQSLGLLAPQYELSYHPQSCRHCPCQGAVVINQFFMWDKQHCHMATCLLCVYWQGSQLGALAARVEKIDLAGRLHRSDLKQPLGQVG